MFAAATVFAYGCSDNFDDSALWKDIDGMYKDVSFRAVPAAGACGADFFIRQAKTSFAGYVFGAGYVFLI